MYCRFDLLDSYENYSKMGETLWGLDFVLQACSEPYCIRWTVEMLPVIKFLLEHAHDFGIHMYVNASPCAIIIDAFIVRSTEQE